MAEQKQEVKQDAPKRREPLQVWFSVDQGGGVMVRGKAEGLRALQGFLDVAVKRLRDGDGSVTLPCRAGKGTGTLTIIAFE